MRTICFFIKRMVLATGLLLFTTGLLASESDTLFSRSFSASLQDFTPLSQIGDQVWQWATYGGVGCAWISGYSTGYFANDDWLISSAIDLTDATNALLTFQHAHRFGTDVERNLTLLVTTNYDKDNFNPNVWRAIPFTHSDGTTYTFVSSGELSLNDYLGHSNVRFAFHYQSSDTATSTWEVKEVLITGTIDTTFSVKEVANLGELREAFDADTSDHTTIYRVTGETIINYTHSTGNLKYLQDATGGIQVYDPIGIVNRGIVGDGVINLTGSLANYNGLLELIPTDNLIVNSTGNELNPIVLTIPEAKARKDRYESMLVHINDLNNISPNVVWLPTKANYPFTTSDNADTIVIRTHFTGLDYMGGTIPTAATNYTGLLIEFNGTVQLCPRSSADIGDNTLPEDTSSLSIILTGGLYRPEETILVSARTSGIKASDRFISYQFDLAYDSNLLAYEEAITTGTISEGGSLIVNSEADTILHVSYMRTTPLPGDGNLVTFSFKALGTGTTTPTITDFLFNADTVYNIKTQAICIEERNGTPGDVDDNGFVQAYDAALTLQYSVGIDPLPDVESIPWKNWRFFAADVDGSTDITANDAALILQYSASLISHFPIEEIGFRSANIDNADVNITEENGLIVFRSVGNLIGLNISVENNHALLGTPTILKTNMLSAVNISDDTYAIGLATTKAPVSGTTLMTIPVNTKSDASITFNLIANATRKSFTNKIMTGVNKNSTVNLTVYPNPVENTMTLTGAKVGSTMRLFDISGKLLLEKPVSGTHEQMDIRSLSNGVYLLKVTSDGNQQVLKVVKK